MFSLSENKFEIEKAPKKYHIGLLAKSVCLGYHQWLLMKKFSHNRKWATAFIVIFIIFIKKKSTFFRKKRKKSTWNLINISAILASSEPNFRLSLKQAGVVLHNKELNSRNCWSSWIVIDGIRNNSVEQVIDHRGVLWKRNGTKAKLIKLSMFPRKGILSQYEG